MKRIVFLGADRFSFLSLQSLLNNSNRIQSLEIISNQSSCPLVQNFKQFPVTICPSKSLSNFNFDLSRFDLGIVSSFALFIPSRIIYQLPLINIHPSLLPRWRGPAPIQYTILKDDKMGGVSIIDLHPKEIDAGNILAQESMQIPTGVNYTDLEAQLAQLGGKLAAQVIDNFDHYWSVKHPQSTEGVTKTKKISKEDGLITFTEQNSSEIDSLCRAVSHQIPIKCHFSDGRPVFVGDLVWGDSVHASEPIFYDKSKSAIFIKTADGRFVGFKSFKIEGKSSIYPAGAFYANFLKNKAVSFL